MINWQLFERISLIWVCLLGMPISNAYAQSTKLNWRDADKVDRMELSDLLEAHIARIHGLGKYMCEYTIDASSDIGEHGVRIEAYSNLVAENGKGALRCISRREDVGRQIGTFSPPELENYSKFFSVDLLKVNGKEYRWGGDHKFELINTTIDSQRKSSLLIQPMIVPLSGGGVESCTSLESNSFEANFSPNTLSSACEDGETKYFRFDAKTKDELAKKGIGAFVILSWKEDLPISFKLYYGKINSPALVNQIETTWKKARDHDVPEKIVREANQGKTTMKINCKWEFDDKVPSILFDEKDLGCRSFVVDETPTKRSNGSK